MIERVTTVGEASWSEDILMYFDRLIPQEEVYVTFSFSPVLGADGHADGTFCARSESTEKIIGARRLETLRQLGLAAESRSADEACRRAAQAMATNPHDIPFAGIYLFDETTREAELVARVGEEARTSAMPERVALDAIAGGFREMHDKRAELAHGPMTLPIRATAHDALAGVLVVGVNPHRPFDAGYRDFFALVQGHIGSAIADARAYEAERRRAEALAEIDRAKTAFFANVSHEFRTPITLMLGPLEDALAEAAPESPQRRRLEMIRRNGVRLLKLVNNLLNFSRLQSGRAQATYVPTDLATITTDLASNFRSACERAGIALTVDCAPLSEPVYVDLNMWEDVVLNLLSNAVKFTREGEISVSLKQEGHHVLLMVADTGVGIAPEEIGHVFERFHRATNENGRTIEGSGIGLSLVQEIVRLHGGDVTVESAPGRGSRFRVRLPLGTAHLDATQIKPVGAIPHSAAAARPYVEAMFGWTMAGEEAPNSHSGEAGTIEDGPRFRILVADDNPDMREYLSSLLSPFADVDVVVDGHEATVSLERRRYDLLVADVMMPRIDGFEVLRRVRAMPDLRTMPVMLLSARAGEEARTEGLAAGADDYLVKPFTRRELVARIVSALVLARSRARAEAERDLLRRELSLAEEAQRRTLARDLHDQLGQHLAAFTLFIADVRRLLAAGESIERRLEQLEELSTAMMRDARNLALELRPPELDDVGLANALETYVRAWSARFGVEAQIAVTGLAGEEAWPAPVANAIYRIVQEALTNVAKHAGAQMVTLQLDRRQEEIRLVVADDGRGFDAEAAAKRARTERRLGLASMRERAALVGGAFDVETSNGNGTTLYVRVPTPVH